MDFISIHKRLIKNKLTEISNLQEENILNYEEYLKNQGKKEVLQQLLNILDTEFLFYIKNKELINIKKNRKYNLTKLESKLLLYLIFNQRGSLNQISDYLYYDDFDYQKKYKNILEYTAIKNKRDFSPYRSTAILKHRLIKRTNLQIKNNLGIRL